MLFFLMPQLWQQLFVAAGKFLLIWYKGLLGLKEGLIRFW